jgi:phosphate transport system protein
MTDHTVKAFDKELGELGAKLAEMGGLAEKMLTDAIDALIRLDLDLARATIATDPRVDSLEREVEERSVLILARRQPMGIDLREIVAAMRIASDLERVGDLAKNIAKRTLILNDVQRLPRAIVGLRHMGQLAALQLKDVLDAYAQRDIERAKAVWSRDAEIDALDDSIFRDLLTFMMEDPRNISPCTHLLFCSKNVERVGDHTTNIAETVHYIITGTTLPVERPKG